MKKFNLSFILIILFCSYSIAQISLTGVGTYTQDFNTLANSGTSSSVPIGWAFAESGTSGNVKLTVYNTLGEQVAELVNGFKEAGIHIINFDAKNLNSGLYIYKIEVNDLAQSRKMIMMK